MSDQLRPNADTIGPRFVCNELVKAEGALVNAQTATEDRSVADSIERARKEIAPAVKRARLILEDVDLRTAPQADLLDSSAPTQGEEDGTTD